MIGVDGDIALAIIAFLRKAPALVKQCELSSGRVAQRARSIAPMVFKVRRRFFSVIVWSYWHSAINTTEVQKNITLSCWIVAHSYGVFHSNYTLAEDTSDGTWHLNSPKELNELLSMLTTVVGNAAEILCQVLALPRATI